MNIPDKVIKLAQTIQELGGRAMLVGGCVRDELMGVQPKDWDVEVYGIEPSPLRKVLDQFGDVIVVGEAFAVYKLDRDLDVSIPRRERKTGKGHRGFSIEGDPAMSFAEACSRRDFTINAILQDPLKGEIVDPFKGRDDLDNKIIKHVSGATFAEDSLRVLRAAQFAARFEFDIAEQTVSICKSIDVTDLPKERVWGEFEKLLIKPERPSVGLHWLYELGVVRQIFPELQSLVDVPQEPEWHPEGSVDIHTMMVADEARKLIDDLPYEKQVTVMLAAIAHDFGKPPTTKFFDGRWRSHSHDEAGVEPTISFLDRLGVFTLNGYDVRDQVIQLVRYHLKPGEFYKAESKNLVGDGAFRRLARKVEPDLLYRVAKADSLGRNPDWLPPEKRFGSEAQEWFIRRVRELNIERKAPEPVLLGRHLIELGLEPGPRFKQILDHVYELQLDGKVDSLEAAIHSAKEFLDKGL